MVTDRMQGIGAARSTVKISAWEDTCEDSAPGTVLTATASLRPGHSTGAAVTRLWVQLLHLCWILSDFLGPCVLCEWGRRASDEWGSGHLLAATCGPGRGWGRVGRGFLCSPEATMVGNPTRLLPPLGCPQRSRSCSWATEKWQMSTRLFRLRNRYTCWAW